MQYLEREGLLFNSYLTGDPMYDAFLFYSARLDPSEIKLTSFNEDQISLPGKYYYLTCHREENTWTPGTLRQILEAMNSLDAPTIYPLHPRNRSTALELQRQYKLENIYMIKPIGYLESIQLTCGAEKIVTDSGGVQREALLAGQQCVTLLDFVVWPETMRGGWNRLCKPEKSEIIRKLAEEPSEEADATAFGDGHAAEKIAEVLRDVPLTVK